MAGSCRIRHARSWKKRYGLVRAEDHKKQLFALKPVDVQKVQYGKLDTRRAIANVLGKVIDSYQLHLLTGTERRAPALQYSEAAGRGDEGVPHL